MIKLQALTKLDLSKGAKCSWVTSGASATGNRDGADCADGTLDKTGALHGGKAALHTHTHTPFTPKVGPSCNRIEGIMVVVLSFHNSTF